MARSDPREVINEVLSRRPDLQAAFAPKIAAVRAQLAARGAPYAGFETTRGQARSPDAFAGSPVMDASELAIPPSTQPFSTGLARKRMDAENALRNPPPPPPRPPTEWSPRYDPLSAALPGPPGSMDYGREAERARMRSPFGPQQPMGSRADLAPGLPPGLTTNGPMPSSFGAGPGRDAARLPQFRPSFAPGTAEASLPPSLPRPRPSPGITPGPMPPDMGLPPRPTLASDTGGLPPQIAELMGGAGQSGVAPAIPSSGATFSPYGPNAVPARMPQYRPPNIPQARPPQSMELTASPPEPPSSPGSVIPSLVDAMKEQTARQAARSTLQLKRNLEGPGDLATRGVPVNPLGTTVMDPMTGLTGAGFDPSSPAPPAPLARLPRPRPDFSPQPGDIIAGPEDTGVIPQGSDLPAPGPTSSLTPQQIQRTMGAQAQSPSAAAFNAPPVSIRSVPLEDAFNEPSRPPLSRDTIRALGFGATDIDPSKAPVVSQTRGVPPLSSAAGNPLGSMALYSGGSGDIPFPGAPPTPPKVPEAPKPFWNAPNIGTAIGLTAGLVAGGAGGAAAGAGLGRLAGKGARFVNNRLINPPPQGVPPITPPMQSPVTAIPGSRMVSGIFGAGKSIAKQAAELAQKLNIPVPQAREMIERSGGDPLGSAGRGSSGIGGGWSGSGGWGGGSSYSGGGYGGNAGGNIMQGTGQRFGQR